MSHSPEVIDKRVRAYFLVGTSLLFLTGLTVAVAFMQMPSVLAVTVALVIATLKGSLVAGFFMHLISERKIIYGVLLLAVVFFIALLFGPLFIDMDGLGS